MKPPVGWWRMASTKAIIGSDITDNTNPAYTYNNAGVWGSSIACTTTLTSGACYINFTLTDKGAWSMWVKHTYSITNGNAAEHWLIGESTYPAIALKVNTATTYLNFGSTTTNRKVWGGSYPEWDVGADTWYNLTFTWSVAANTYAFYFNGAAVTLPAKVVDGTPGTGVTIKAHLGTPDTTLGLDGYIDDFKVFDYVPTAAEILRIVNAERGPLNDQII